MQCYIILCKPAELFLVSEYISQILINIDIVYSLCLKDAMRSPTLSECLLIAKWAT